MYLIHINYNTNILYYIEIKFKYNIKYTSYTCILIHIIAHK